MRSKLGVFGFLLLVGGCGGTEAPSEVADDTTPPPPTVEKGQAFTEKAGVFVTASGSPDGDGSRAKPLASLEAAITLAKSSGKSVFVCLGTYKEQLVVENGVSISGDLDCSNPEAWRVTSKRARLEAPTTIAVVADGITSPTRIEGFDVVATDAREPSQSSIGLRAVGSPALVFANGSLRAGKGAAGIDGVEGTPLTIGTAAKGTAGIAAETCSGDACDVAPASVATGGKSVCTGAPGHDGEAGGEGGKRGLYEKAVDDASQELIFQPFAKDITNAAQAAPSGRTGAAGADGGDGVSATSWGKFTREGFVPKDGTAGTDGAPGKGGRGGDGAAPHYAAASGGPDHHYGNGGGGGGAGGCPGLAGTAGRGGGASIAALLVDSPIVFDATELFSGSGGAGGKGTFGSDATHGGEGGANGHEGAAQSGGRGGLAGIGGNGAGGPSIAIAYTGGEPAINASITLGKGGAGVFARTKEADGTNKTIPASIGGAPIRIYPF